MHSNTVRFSQFSSAHSRRVAQVEEFLTSVDLELTSDIELFVVAYEGREMIACGGLSGKVLKCIAVAPHLRGQGFILTIMSELIKAAYAKGQEELFLFSNPKNQHFFEECGFKLIQKSGDKVILMENNDNLQNYKKRLQKEKKQGKHIGSIVMNANPFTLGHQHLVEKAAKRCDWLHLFVVREDASFFAYEDRLRLIKKGLEHIKNITIHEGSDYLISKATFPTYFIKDKGEIDSIYSSLDLNIFKEHIAPPLGITHRYVGCEPFCVVTNEYNQQMKKLLHVKSESAPIEVVEIPRFEKEGRAISASLVRRLLSDKKMEELRLLVPPSTYNFLQTNY